MRDEFWTTDPNEGSANAAETRWTQNIRCESHVATITFNTLLNIDRACTRFGVAQRDNALV